jgi:L-threonylcarbamoyladenylate synthase
MATKRQTQTVSCSALDAVGRATELIAQAESVIVPTETVYGLTAAADLPQAVKQVFALKGRDLEKPSAIYLSHSGEVDNYAMEISAKARRVLNELLPGPLTVVLKARLSSWPGVVGQDGKIGIRISSEPFISELIQQCRRPLLATSASISGQGDLSDVAAVENTFAGRVPLIVYKKEMLGGMASTVIDLSGVRAVVLRQGELQLPEWVLREEG